MGCGAKWWQETSVVAYIGVENLAQVAVLRGVRLYTYHTFYRI